LAAGVAVGEGGTAADIRGDEAYDLPPLNLALAGTLIGRARVARLMAGLPGERPVSRPAVADALVRLSQIAVDFPEIAALTVNPLFVDPDGVLAADAELVLRPAGETGRLAIPPYPAELARPWTAKSGETLVIRPVRPEDAAAHGEFFKRLDPQDIRYRFFSPIRELSREMTARLTQIDYDREMALVAVVKERSETASGEIVETERIVGVSRYITNPDQSSCEFALLVADDFKGKGLGSRLMESIMDVARDKGLADIEGLVLAKNSDMLDLMKSLGFRVQKQP
jgi:acetyltransferase